MKTEIADIKESIVTAMNSTFEAKSVESALALKTAIDAINEKSDVTSLEFKSQLDALTEAGKTIELQGKELAALTQTIEEVKNFAADAEAKAASRNTNMEHKSMELKFDEKLLSDKLKEVFLSGEKADFAKIDTKSLSIGGAGGEVLAIDEELGRTIIERARENVAILGLVANKNVGSVEYREMVLRNRPAVGKVLENTSGAAAWSLTGTQTYVGVAMTVAKQYAKPVISDEAIADPHIDIYSHLQTLLSEETARYWAIQVLFGTGAANNELRGILNESASAGRLDATESLDYDNSTRDVNLYMAKVSGTDDSIGDDVTAIDNAIDMTTVVPSRYLGTSVFVMNRRTLGNYRKLRDADNKPLIQFEAGGFFLVGYAIVLEDYMPNEDGTVQGTAMTGKKFPVIFGDLGKAFALCSIDDNFLVDPYSADGGVTIKYSSRKGDIVQNNDAIVVLCTRATWV
jgi:HK97 family phage major capsid protein